MTDIKSMTLEEITEAMRAAGEPSFRGKQVFAWLHRGATAFDQMLNIPKPLREKLAEQYCITAPEVARRQVSKLDGTIKYLWELADGNCIETVLMSYHHGNTVCISSQVGCRMGCRFCASTLDGLERNLTPGEMLDQIYAITRYTEERVSNVVVMGTGEPMDNYDNLLTFIKMLTDEHGLHISQRNITVSTCGLVPMMKKLAEEELQITLALSLHAVTDEKRRELMPIANKYSIAELMEACDYYFAKTGRRISFEYSLVGGVNDTKEDAEGLIALAGKRNCHINLIPVNPIKERDYVQSEKEAIMAFKGRLEKSHINVTVRREMGRDIDGACGQLRRKKMQEKKEQQ